MLEFEIQPKYPFDKVEIRPSSLKIVPEITKYGIIKFLLPKVAYFTVEPYGIKNALHIFADLPSSYSSIDKTTGTLYISGKASMMLI